MQIKTKVTTKWSKRQKHATQKEISHVQHYVLITIPNKVMTQKMHANLIVCKQNRTIESVKQKK